MNDKHNQPHPHRIVLSSGRSTKIARLGQGADRPAVPRPLYLCPQCDCDLVQPLRWTPACDGFQLELCCPNCWWAGSELAGEQRLRAFENHLDEGLEVLLGDLQRLAHTNMLEEIERFAAALERDAILPEDF